MTHSDPEIRRAIRSFIRQVGGRDDFSDDDDLVKNGLIQSVRLMELIDLVADGYGFDVSATDVYDGRFRTCAAIAALVAERAR